MGLRSNITKYTEHFKKSQMTKISSQVMTNKSNVSKLQKFTTSLNETNEDLMEWNEAMQYFDNDQELMINLIDNDILSRKHGNKLSSNLEELMHMKLLGKDDNIYVGTIAECCDSLVT